MPIEPVRLPRGKLSSDARILASLGTVFTRRCFERVHSPASMQRLLRYYRSEPQIVRADMESGTSGQRSPRFKRYHARLQTQVRTARLSNGVQNGIVKHEGHLKAQSAGSMLSRRCGTGLCWLCFLGAEENMAGRPTTKLNHSREYSKGYRAVRTRRSLDLDIPSTPDVNAVSAPKGQPSREEARCFIIPPEEFLPTLHHPLDLLMVHFPLLRKLLHLSHARVYDISRAGAWAKYDLKTGTRGDDEGRGLVIES